MAVNLGYVDKKIIQDHKNEEENAKTLLIIAGNFLLFWLPLMTSLLIVAIFDIQDFPGRLMTTFTVLSHYCSAVCPLIYTYRIPEVGKAFKSFITFRRPDCDVDLDQNTDM